MHLGLRGNLYRLACRSIEKEVAMKELENVGPKHPLCVTT
jgi:hypothetical protein